LRPNAPPETGVYHHKCNRYSGIRDHQPTRCQPESQRHSTFAAAELDWPGVHRLQCHRDRVAALLSAAVGLASEGHRGRQPRHPVVLPPPAHPDHLAHRVWDVHCKFRSSFGHLAE
ncbi:MAG: hypothetical protein ACK53V_23370, partial [Planctomycetota bacterium]